MSAPNVLLVTVDGLRHDRLSSYGYTRPTTPTLDSIGDRGSIWENAIATGTGTILSFPGILTSSYPLMYGGYAQLTEDRMPISSAFKDHGYVTLGVNTNAHLHHRFGWDRGFDVYVGGRETFINEPVGEFERKRTADESDESGFRLEDAFDDLKTRAYQSLDHDGLLYRTLEAAYRRIDSRELPHPEAADVVDTIVDTVEKLPDDRPFFLWAHFMEAHSPYLPPEEYRDQFLSQDLSEAEIWRLNDHLHEKPDAITDDEVELISDLYDASVRYFDDEFGRLLGELGLEDDWGDTLFAFTADHGEQFREYGELTHCSEPYDVGVHVPLVVKFGNEDLRDVSEVTSTMDIAPTLLDAAIDDVTLPDAFHGLSLVDALRGDGHVPADRTVFSQQASNPQYGPRDIDLSNRTTGCRTSEWKYMTFRNPDKEDKLFYLPDDPGEQHNVIDDHPEVVERFDALLEEHYETAPYTDYQIESAIDSGDIEDQLEALGYVDG